MAKAFSNFRLISASAHPLGASALMDITNHGVTQTVVIKQHRGNKKWYYGSGIQKELPTQVLGQLCIPESLSTPFWWQDSDASLSDALTQLTRKIDSLRSRLDQNEKDLYRLRGGNRSNFEGHINELLDQRIIIRDAIRELMSLMVKTDLVP